MFLEAGWGCPLLHWASILIPSPPLPPRHCNKQRAKVLVGAIGALTFSGFIVYDTRRMAEGNHPGISLSSNQYVKGAMALYMDIMNLFVYLLRLFGERER